MWGAEIVQLVVGGVVVNDELEIMLLGSPRLCVGSSPKPFSWNGGEMGTAPFFASLLVGRACRRNGSGSFNYLLFSLWNLNYQRKPAYGGFADGLANKQK